MSAASLLGARLVVSIRHGQWPIETWSGRRIRSTRQPTRNRTTSRCWASATPSLVTVASPAARRVVHLKGHPHPGEDDVGLHDRNVVPVAFRDDAEPVTGLHAVTDQRIGQLNLQTDQVTAAHAFHQITRLGALARLAPAAHWDSSDLWRPRDRLVPTVGTAEVDQSTSRSGVHWVCEEGDKLRVLLGERRQ